MPKLTKRIVDAAQPTDRESFIWDSELPGFGLRIFPSGKRSYLVQYRHRGRTRRIAIGPHGRLTPDEARRQAIGLLAEVAKGRDPAEAKTEARRDMTVAALADLYLAEGVATKKPLTVRSDRGRIEGHIKPLLGTRLARSIQRADVERVMRDVAAGRTARRVRGQRQQYSIRGGEGVAVQCVALLSAMFVFAVERGIVLANPALGVKKFKIRKMERFLSPAELARLGDALAAAEGEGESPFAVACIRLLILTGCRRSEILGLEWRHVDFEHALLRLPDSKTGAKVVYLSAPALEVLASMPRVDGNPYVICGDKPGGHFIGLAKPWYRIRERAGLPNVRLHDLRHSFASVGAAGGQSLPVIGALLGHRQTTTTARYAHLAADPLRAANEAIGQRIAAAMRPKDPDTIVEMKRNG